jgi:hypothetical protein
MGYRRTRRNRRTKNRRYRKQKGGNEIVQSTSVSTENEKKESVGEKVSGMFDNVTEWFEKPEWFSSSSQTAGKRRKRKHRRTYKK